ncbi:PadR family transcriptional regulator [Enterococcus raffinosus]
MNKKVYYITDTGKEYFQKTISQPILYKEKNMELSKFFFMGFTDEIKRDELLANYIKELEQELASLEKLSERIGPRFKFDETTINDLKERGGAVEFMTLKNVEDIARFQYTTLDLGIEKAKFEIQWFKQFRKRLNLEPSKKEQ